MTSEYKKVWILTEEQTEVWTWHMNIKKYEFDLKT